MNAALDIVAEQKAFEILLARDMAEDEARAKLEPMSTFAILRTFLIPAMQLPDDSPRPWTQWLETHRKLRNRVVHDAYEPTIEEAEESLRHVSKLCVFLRTLAVCVEDEDEGES